MPSPSQLCLNRIACPSLSLEEMLALAREVGITQVELRNDLTSGAVTDGHPPADVRAHAEAQGVRIVTVNALQRFNLAAVRAEIERQLRDLLVTCKALGCEALVLCPNNDTRDRRDRDTMWRETVAALQALRPLFEDSGVTGLVEPLGFPESSLRSLVDAQRAIQESGGTCFATVHDTFHHFLGPDTAEIIDSEYDVRHTGLVHISGVEAEVPGNAFRDPHRILVGPADKLQSKAQVLQLARLGYEGPISFEPFSPSVQSLDRAALATALQQSIAYLDADQG